jgi:hypothetical protein
MMGLKKYGKKVRENEIIYNVMHYKSRLNSEKIWKIQKKSKLNSEKIWKLWKKNRFPNLFTF